MEKFLENLQEAEKTIQTIDHMIYITFPIVKDKKLLLKIILETKTAIAKCINSILQYEYIYKRIRLHKSSKTNFRTFEDKCAPRYNITKEETKLILELFDIVEKHKQSPMEFVKDDKIVILSNNMDQKTVTVEKSKEFLSLAKSVLGKAKEAMKQ